MSATNRGARRYSHPRYRSGSRAKTHQIAARPVRRNPPDLAAFGHAIIRAAMNQASIGRPTAAQPGERGPSDRRPPGCADQSKGSSRG
jgi:hypothetical protein